MDIRLTNQLGKIRIILGAPYWELSGVNIFSANLVREFQKLNLQAKILLTEYDTELVQLPNDLIPLPTDIPVERLPVSRDATWGRHWQATIDYLERNAPCIYIPNFDWRHSNVSPHLSPNVGIVGVVHSDDPLHYDHVSRLGRYWNGIVTVSDQIADKVLDQNPELSSRLQVIPIGVPFPAEFLPREKSDDAPLRMIYHGKLSFYQKRIQDLIKVVEKLDAMNVPVVLTVAGSGPDEKEFIERANPSIEKGQIQYLGFVPHDATIELLKKNDVYIMTSDFEGMPNALIEAMAYGCIPVVSNIKSGIPNIIKNGENGYLADIGDINQFAKHIEFLSKNPDIRKKLAQAAYVFVKEEKLGADEMARSYLKLFEKIRIEINNKTFHRPKSDFLLPPQQVKGITILPGEYTEEVKIVEDHLEKGKRRKLKKSKPEDKDIYRVIVGATSGRLSGVDVFSINLVRSLKKLGIPAEILKTMPYYKPSDAMGFPSDILVRNLPVSKTDSWNTKWKTLIDYLELCSPCIYIPNYDWNHSGISPVLPDDVGIVGIVHSDDPLHYEHVGRLGAYWNGIVAVSSVIHKKTLEANPNLSSRLVTIPYGVNIPNDLPAREIKDREHLKICYAGRLVQEQKRIFDVIAILDLLTEAKIPFVMTIIGGGGEESKFLKMAKEHISNGTLKFMGILPNNEVLEIFQENDVFLLTSEYEGLPVSLLEAMSQGCIPVVTAIESGIPEIINDGENGFMLPVGDFKGFAKRLEWLQKNPALRTEIRENVYYTIRNGNYNSDIMTRNYQELFEKVWTDKKEGKYYRPLGKISPPQYMHSFSETPEFIQRIIFAMNLDFIKKVLGVVKKIIRKVKSW